MRNFIDIVNARGISRLDENALYWTPERVEKLTQEFNDKSFGTPEIARSALLQTWRSMRRSDEPGMFTDSEDKMLKKWAGDAPTFAGKTGIHLGAEQHRCPWTDMEIRREDGRYIHDTAQAQSEYDYDIIPIRNYDLDLLLGPQSEDRYMVGTEGERCKRLAERIHESGWFTAIIVDVSDPKAPFIVEGQHRARAARLLGFNTVPAHGLDFGEDDAAINESEAMGGSSPLYHVTPTKNVRSIMRKGLIPAIGDRSTKIESQPGIYLFASLDDVENGMNWLADEFDEDEPLTVLKVTLPPSIPVSREAFEIVCHQPIPSLYIEITEVQL